MEICLSEDPRGRMALDNADDDGDKVTYRNIPLESRCMSFERG